MAQTEGTVQKTAGRFKGFPKNLTGSGLEKKFKGQTAARPLGFTAVTSRADPSIKKITRCCCHPSLADRPTSHANIKANLVGNLPGYFWRTRMCVCTVPYNL
jgi:hypothetical protein